MALRGRWALMEPRTNLGYALDVVVTLLEGEWLTDEERVVLTETKERLERAMRLLYGEMQA